MNEIILSHAQYFIYCINADIGANVVCRPFWENAMRGSLLFGVSVLILCAINYISWRFKLAAALKAEAARQAVNHEEIEKARWTGDDFYEHT